MQHVGTGDMDEGKRFSTLPGMTQDVMQVANTIDMKRRIRIARHARATRMHEVVVQHPFLLGLKLRSRG